MVLKTGMEENQLNLNQPFLSVRRISSNTATAKDDNKSTTNISSNTFPQPPPYYKSELKSGPVSNPGVVPFLWERSPGRPKDETSSRTDTADRPPIVPKLPPGRTLKAPESPTITKSEMGNLHFQPLSKKVEKPGSFGSSNDTKEEEDEEKFLSEDDEDETYVDALDTLSRTESSFLNCSVSGLSGLDEPDRNNNPSGTFPTDPQTQDFMMGRFLPAAKAMASDMTSEVPQYTPKKQPVVQEQLRQPNKAIKSDRRPQLRYGPSFARHYYQSHDYAEEEGSGDDEHEYLPPKACGLLPRFCLKIPCFLMNPVPGMSVRTRRVPMSPTSSGTENERSTSNGSEQQSMFGLLTAEAHENIYDHKLDESSTREDSGNPVVEKTLYVDTVHTVESSPPQLIKEILTEKTGQKLLKDFPFTEAGNLNFVDEGTKTKPVQESLLNSEFRRKPRKAYGKTGFFNKGSNTSVKLESEADESCIKKETKTEKLEITHRVNSEFPVPPPLPISPSESWLCRTLPSLPTKNSSLRPYLGNGNPKNQAFKESPGDPKWETMVKTTKGNLHHLRYSQEIMALTPIPETQ